MPTAGTSFPSGRTETPLTCASYTPAWEKGTFQFVIPKCVIHMHPGVYRVLPPENMGNLMEKEREGLAQPHPNCKWECADWGAFCCSFNTPWSVKNLLHAFFHLPLEKDQNYNQEANNLLWTVVFVEACSFQMGIWACFYSSLNTSPSQHRRLHWCCSDYDNTQKAHGLITPTLTDPWLLTMQLQRNLP